jgi:hypothetical protein
LIGLPVLFVARRLGWEPKEDEGDDEDGTTTMSDERCTCDVTAWESHKGISCECGQTERPHHHRGSPRERKFVCAVCKKLFTVVKARG